MKKNTTGVSLKKQFGLTIGLDLGDAHSYYCVLSSSGEVLREDKVATTERSVQAMFAALQPSLVAMEVGTHSPWVSRLIAACGHEVIVANARQVRLITESSHKNDKLDARALARLARVDPSLLKPIRHRSAEAQAHLAVIRARAVLVEARTKLVNSARGLMKASGRRLSKCAAQSVKPTLLGDRNDTLAPALRPLLAAAAALTVQIKESDRQIAEIAKLYSAVARLDQVTGVGTLIALTYVLTLEDPLRFTHSRDVGGYVGLTPRHRDSGQRVSQLRISKEGDCYLRTLLVQGAHYILGPFGPDTDLRRHGERISARGGKNAKKRAAVAVARKLAILLHRLWVTGEGYQPLRNSKAAMEPAA